MPSIYLVLRSIVPPPMTTEVAANAVPNNLNRGRLRKRNLWSLPFLQHRF